MNFSSRVASATSALALVISVTGAAQAASSGVCNRAHSNAVAQTNQHMNQWAAGIEDAGLPRNLTVAMLEVIEATRANALAEAAAARDDCTNSTAAPQDIIDASVLVISGGLSALFPNNMAYVDISEIMGGYPLGGPDALIPRFREQILGNGNGTIANIIRDPIRCVTFRRRC
ncbi:hypothetical protein [Pararhodobacter aggregans]|uniref:Uncharacterized protein n=1 Tax=Pararhodobacter aggregans TaxID=404875 RepID=A0A2T7UMH2_9RHOB|nr:hypothetical protein [Pararhodobacter aggregans]PTW99141.1 hypothetical protein C8N33_11744 [Pararhodobacter aggregans]PVE45864.1 hypothetical protein DDE23_18775 [Pararhodobacter aggregans]